MLRLTPSGTDKSITRLAVEMNIFYRIVSQVFGHLRALYWKSVYEGFRKKYLISHSFRFNGAGIRLYGDGSISLGENSYIGELSTVQASVNCRVAIGKDTCISHNVRIYTQSYVADYDFSRKPLLAKSGDVIIGNYCWIGANVFINSGVVIGENSVIGANSVVTKNVPTGEIWGGVPAKKIKGKSI